MAGQRSPSCQLLQQNKMAPNQAQWCKYISEGLTTTFEVSFDIVDIIFFLPGKGWQTLNGAVWRSFT